MSISPALSVRTRKTRGHGSERHGEILAAAKRLFLEEGVKHATMRRIADAVGVSPTALYVYFPNKEAIHHAIAEATFAEMLAALESSQRGPGTATERMRAGLRAYIKFAMERPDEYRLTFLTAGGTLPDADPCHDIDDADRSFAVLQRGVQEMMDEGSFATGSAELVAETIWAALHGVTALSLDHAGHLASDPARLAEAVIEMTISGCSP